MSWSQAFRDELAKSHIAPVWQLRTVQQPLTTRTPVVISSHPGLSGLTAFGADGVAISGEAVDPLNWNTTHGGFRVSLAGPAMENVWRNFRRGVLVQLFMGFAGWAEADFEPVALGMISQIRTTSANSWEVEVGGLGQVLKSRLDRTPNVGPLFYLLPQETTLASDFDAAHTSAVLTDASGFERETGGSYLLLVTPTTGEPFYVLGTGKSSNTITGITATVAALDTARVNAVAGDAVQSVAYITGHPCDVARKVLCSTGAGTNGTYDTLPVSWGIGLPDSLLDHADIAWVRNVAMAVSAGSWSMVMTATELVSDPQAWLASFLAPAGLWLTVRQGRLSLRAAQIPMVAKVRTGFEVGPWISRAGISSHDFYDGRYGTGYTTAHVTDSGTSPSTTEQKETSQDNAGGGTWEVVLACYGGSSATQYMRGEVSARTWPWVVRVPECMVIDCSGWWLSQLCPGDIVQLTTDRRRGRPGGSAVHGSRYVDRAVMVLGVAPVLLPGGSYTTRLELAILPETTG